MTDQLPKLHRFNPNAPRRNWVPAAYSQVTWPTFPSAPIGNGRNTAAMSFLYRFYDENEDPLYIGVTTNPTNRWAAHVNSDWWQLARFVSLAAVDPARRLLFEQLAIKAERPRFNRTSYTSNRTVIDLTRGMPYVVEQLARRMTVEDFADLVREFRALGDNAPMPLPGERA